MQFSAVSHLCFLPIILMPAGVIRCFDFFILKFLLLSLFAICMLCLTDSCLLLPSPYWQGSCDETLNSHNVLNACRSATATLTLAQADWFHFHVTFTHSSGNSDSCLWLCFHSLSAGVLRQSTCQLFPLPCQQIVKGSELSCTTYQQSKKTPQNPNHVQPIFHFAVTTLVAS